MRLARQCELAMFSTSFKLIMKVCFDREATETLLDLALSFHGKNVTQVWSMKKKFLHFGKDMHYASDILDLSFIEVLCT